MLFFFQIGFNFSASRRVTLKVRARLPRPTAVLGVLNRKHCSLFQLIWIEEYLILNYLKRAAIALTFMVCKHRLIWSWPLLWPLNLYLLIFTLDAACHPIVSDCLRTDIIITMVKGYWNSTLHFVGSTNSYKLFVFLILCAHHLPHEHIARCCSS